MDRSPLKATTGGRAQPAAPPRSPLPGVVDGAAGQRRRAQGLVEPRLPSRPVALAESGDLVARALAILAEEADASRARGGFPPRSIR